MGKAIFKARDFNLSGLAGISDETLEMHFELYGGYVAQANELTERLAELNQEGRASGKDPVYAELTRRRGFEYGGVVLHEHYFDNLAPQGRDAPSPALTRAIEQSFRSFDAWRADFVAIGGMRGVGWAVLFRDPATGQLSNHWITLHEQGVPAGHGPILVMDVWEHAYLLDYKPADRGKYIEAFFANVDWRTVSRRMGAA